VNGEPLTVNYLLFCQMPRIYIRNLITLCVLSVSIVLLSCQAGNTQASSNVSLEEVVKSKLGPQFSTDHNSNHSYALCQQTRSENDHARRNFKYIVVRLSDNKIMNEGSFVMGHVKWVSNNAIEVATASSNNDSLQTKKIVVDSEQ
jgi:hypothetical protein